MKQNSRKRIYNIHIQDPKINFKLFDFIIAPEHDEISGSNVISTKGAIHYLNKSEIVSNSEYLKSLIKTDKRKIFSLILGGPTTVSYTHLTLPTKPSV